MKRSIFRVERKEATALISHALGALAALAVMTEFFTEMLKESVPFMKKIPPRLTAAVIGIALCFLTDNGMLALAGGFIRYPWLDYILSGLIISRGAGVIHDLIETMRRYSRSFKAPS